MKFQDMPYSRVDFEEASRRLAQLMKEFEEASTAEEELEVHRRYYELSDHVKTMSVLANIRHSIDTSDAYYAGEKEYYDRMLPVFTNQEVQYKNLLRACPHRRELEKVTGRPAFAAMELAARSVSEEIIPLMQEENALVTRYEKLLAGARIEWEGKTLNLSMMTPHLTSPDREERIRAARSVNAFYEGISQELDEIYDLLVKNRTAQAKELGFESFTPLGYCRMMRSSYGRAEVERFRRQIKEDWVPFAEKIWENRKKRLGLERLLHLDEGVSFLEGSPRPQGTPEEILAAGERMYDELSPETAEFFHFMRENELLDVFSRENKQVGGYMEYLPQFRAPFIFANFNGTSGDVDVITHECGHAFQGYLAGKDDEVREHWDITMETAETHSMSMEFFTNPWMKHFFGDRTEDFLIAQLEDAVTFIPYGCMVDEFQHEVYDHPEMTPQERKQVWKRLEQEYKPHLSYGAFSDFYEKGGFWQRQHHIYSFPFYYIDYAIAQTNALQYRLWMEKDRGAAWASYLKLCRLSASDFFVQMLTSVGLENPFAEGTIGALAEGLEELYGEMLQRRPDKNSAAYRE